MLRQLLLISVFSIVVVALVEFFVATYRPETVSPFTACGGPLGPGPLPHFIVTGDKKIYLVSGRFVNLYSPRVIYYLSSDRGIVYLRVWREPWGGPTPYPSTRLVGVYSNLSTVKKSCTTYLLDDDSLTNISLIYGSSATGYVRGVVYFDKKTGNSTLLELIEKLAIGKSDNCVFLERVGEVARVYLYSDKLKKILMASRPHYTDFFLVVIVELDGDNVKLYVPKYPQVKTLSELAELIHASIVNGSKSMLQSTFTNEAMIAIYNSLMPSISICSNIGYIAEIKLEEGLRTLSAIVIAGGVLVYDYRSNRRSYRRFFSRAVKLLGKLRRKGRRNV